MISNQYKIEKSFYEIIQQLFEIASSQIRKPEKRTVTKIINGEEVEFKTVEIRTDGEIYYFSTTNSNGDLLIGTTHSPRKNTLMGKLVDICNELYSLSQGKEILKDEVVAKMESLITDMQTKSNQK
jgi:hypothetical protein